MVEVNVHSELVLDEPVLVEGLPGVGLVGKIAADHVIDELGMEYVGDVTGDGIPQVAVFDRGHELNSPVRLFADEANDLLALRSDVPVSATSAPAFAAELTAWLADRDALPIYLTGFPRNREPDALPELYGVATGEAAAELEAAAVDPPDEKGMISGPAGALLSRAREANFDAVGLVVETDPRFPDPQGARVLVERGIAPLSGVEIDTARLVERADRIVEQRERLARQMQQADSHESSQASHLDMYQ